MEVRCAQAPMTMDDDGLLRPLLGDSGFRFPHRELFQLWVTMADPGHLQKF